MIQPLVRLIADDQGQDLVEYALLSGVMGVVGLLIFPEIVEKMTAAYTNTIDETQAVWVPCPPDPASCP